MNFLLFTCCWVMCTSMMFNAYFDKSADKKLIDSATIALSVLDQYVVLNTEVNVYFTYAKMDKNLIASTNYVACPSLQNTFTYTPASLFVNKNGKENQCYHDRQTPFYHMTVKITNNPYIFFYDGDVDTIPFHQYDLPTIMLHELMHGLGISSFIREDGTSAYAPYISLYDTLLFNLSAIDPFVKLDVSVILGNPLYYAKTNYQIYSSNPFWLGTSFVHGKKGLLNFESTLGITYRMMDFYMIRILRDMGYAVRNCEHPDDSTVCLFCEKGFTCQVSGVDRLVSFLF